MEPSHQHFCQHNKMSKDLNKVIKISLQWKINRKWATTKTQVKNIKLMTVKALAKLIRNSILALVVRILANRIYTIKIVNNSSFFSLISLPIKRLDLIHVQMYMKHLLAISNFRRQEEWINWNQLEDIWAVLMEATRKETNNTIIFCNP